MQNLLDELKETLAKDERLVIDGRLAKNKIAELALKMDEGLLELLLSNEQLKKHFFRSVNGTYVFDKLEFQRFISNKAFLPDSYTAFKNKIGLTHDGGDSYLAERKEVSLIWPYKDCVLEGGQTKEDAKRNEIFWNQTLAPDQIDRLLDPKAFTGFKKFDKDGEHEIEEFSAGDNLIIKGNNLLALHSLKKIYAGKVKLIYIDPPFNTGNDSFKYNDRFNHSTWLTFMKNRFKIAKDLLANDGSIYVHLDHNEVYYCKILLDEVFGHDNFQREIIWSNETSSGFKSQANNWIRGHDNILFYSKGKHKTFNKLFHPLDEKTKKRYDKTDEDGRKYKVYYDNNNERRVYLDKSKGKPMTDTWKDIIGFQTANRGGETLGFEGQKPEALIQRILAASSNENDIVLDFFAGSGSTGAVAHKMNRKYILIEQMSDQTNILKERITNVMEGDDTGISKEVDWQGGGSFVYAELLQYNARFIEEIEEAGSKKKLQKIWQRMQESAFLSYKVNPKDINKEKGAFNELTLDEQKQFLVEVLDKNQLYVNYSEIEDEAYGISEEVKEQNHQFYKMSEP